MENEERLSPISTRRNGLKRKKNSVPSRDDAYPSTSRQLSSPEKEELPGFVYDPVSKRHFRVSQLGPDNNYNVSTDRLLSRLRETTRRRETWIDMAVTTAGITSRSVLLSSTYCPKVLFPVGYSKRQLAAFRHRYLLPLRSAARQVFSDSTVVSSSSKRSTAPRLVEFGFGTIEEPRVIMAAGNADDHWRPRVLIDLYLPTFKWVNGKNCSAAWLCSKDDMPFRLTNIELPLPRLPEAKVEKISSLPGNSDDFLLLCGVKTQLGDQMRPLRGRLFRVSLTHEIQLIGSFPHTQRICAVSADQAHPIVATATSDSGELHLTRLEDSAMKKFMLSGIVTCLDFSPLNHNLLYAGNAASLVFQMDFRQTRHSAILSAGSWKQFDVSGHSVITSMKILRDNYRFVTTIAALPEKVPKMLLWDSRSLRQPVALFEDTFSPFDRRPPTLSFSHNDALVVASDSAGVTRFWDVDSGCLLALLPPPASVTLDEIDNFPPVSVICENEKGSKALLQVMCGGHPSVHVLNLQK